MWVLVEYGSGRRHCVQLSAWVTAEKIKGGVRKFGHRIVALYRVKPQLDEGED